MSVPYRGTPDGPFTVSVTLDAAAHDALRRAARGSAATWLALLASPALTALSLLGRDLAAGFPVAASLAVAAHVAFVAYAWRTQRQRAAALRAREHRLEVSIGEAGVDLAGEDGGRRHWDWSHVAEVTLLRDALVLVDAHELAVVVPATAHPELARIAAFARARASGRRFLRRRGLAIVPATHAALLAVALTSQLSSAPAPAHVLAPTPARPRSPNERVAAALARGEAPAPADLAAPRDLCEEDALTDILSDHDRLDLLPDRAPLEAAHVHFSRTSGICRASDARVLGIAELDDALLGRCTYVAFGGGDDTADELSWWTLVGPEVEGPGPSRRLAEPEWVEVPYSPEGLVRRSAARHWLVFGRGPEGAPRLVGAPE